jgi:elongation factor G
MQLPIGAESDLQGVVDLIEMKALIWRDEVARRELGRSRNPGLISRTRPKNTASIMIETVVEADEDAMEAYLEGEMPDNDKIRELVRKGTCAVQFFPIFCGSAFKNKGVQPLCSTRLSTTCRARLMFRRSRVST